MDVLDVPFFESDMVEPRENRIHMMLSHDELTAIDDWRFANKVATRSEAIRRLCQIGMAYEEKSAELADNAASGINIIGTLMSQIAEAEGDKDKMLALFEDIIMRYHGMTEAVFFPLVMLRQSVEELSERKSLPKAIEEVKINSRIVSERMAGWRDREDARLEEKYGGDGDEE